MNNRVVYSCAYVPAEWLAAHNLQPHRLIPGAPTELISGPTRMGGCPFARALVDEIAAMQNVAGVVFTTLCDQMRRAAEQLQAGSEHKVFLFNLPSTWQSANAQQMYREELTRLGAFLERIGGSAPTTTKLTEVMTQYDVAREQLRNNDGGMPAREAAERMIQFPTTGENSKPTTTLEPDHGKTRLALIGGPIPRHQWWLFDEIESAGGQIILDATDTGERTLPGNFECSTLCDEPLDVLAQAYFGTIPHAFQRPNDRLYNWLKQKLSERRVQGVILRRCVWCDIWHAESQQLKEKIGLPTLDLDLDDADEKARVRSRLHAFMEMFA